jgi:hypothetical protein
MASRKNASSKQEQQVVSDSKSVETMDELTQEFTEGKAAATAEAGKRGRKASGAPKATKPTKTLESQIAFDTDNPNRFVAHYFTTLVQRRVALGQSIGEAAEQIAEQYKAFAIDACAAYVPATDGLIGVWVENYFTSKYPHLAPRRRTPVEADSN